MSKKFIVLLALLIVMPVWAKTDLFGDVRQLSIVASEESASIQAGFRPLPDIFWGPVVKFDTDPMTSSHARISNTYVGLAVEYPIVSAASLMKILDVNGIGYVGMKGLWDIDTPDTYLDFVVGLDVLVRKSDSSSTHLRFEYIKPDGASPLNEDMLTVGFAVRWR